MKDEDYIGIPILTFKNKKPEMEVKMFLKDDPSVDYKRDPRFLYYRGETYDIIYSHFRLARSKDGREFILDDKPLFCSENLLTTQGIHDPRVIHLNNTWQLLYSGNSKWGIPMFRATTDDWQHLIWNVIICGWPIVMI